MELLPWIESESSVIRKGAEQRNVKKKKKYVYPYISLEQIAQAAYR